MFKVIKYAEDKGMEKGMKKGREEERKTVAKNLLSLGMGDDFVMKATGLDKKIINALKKTLTPSV